jgi:hypothetical protein
VFGGPCGVFVTREIKEEGSLGLSDRLREGKGWNRPGLCYLLNRDSVLWNRTSVKQITMLTCLISWLICFPSLSDLSLTLTLTPDLSVCLSL